MYPFAQNLKSDLSLKTVTYIYFLQYLTLTCLLVFLCVLCSCMLCWSASVESDRDWEDAILLKCVSCVYTYLSIPLMMMKARNMEPVASESLYMQRGARYKASPHVVREYMEKVQRNKMRLCRRKRMKCLWEVDACAICCLSGLLIWLHLCSLPHCITLGWESANANY